MVIRVFFPVYNMDSFQYSNTNESDLAICWINFTCTVIIYLHFTGIFRTMCVAGITHITNHYKMLCDGSTKNDHHLNESKMV